MQRYKPILLLAFFFLFIVAVCNVYLSGYAGKQDPAFSKTLTIYTTVPVEQMTVLTQEYEKSQNVHLNLVPLSDQDILSRLQLSPENGPADIIIGSKALLEAAKRQQALAAFTSEQTDVIPEKFKEVNGYWVGLWYDPVVFAINTDFLKGLPQPPEKWTDLAKNDKLRMGITDFLAAESAANLLYTFTEINGEEYSLAYFKKLHHQIVQYSKFLATPVRMVGMGEVDLAIAVQSEVVRYINDSFPIKIIYPGEGTAYLLTGAAVLNGSGNKTDAEMFIDWLTQDQAQYQLYKNRFFFIPTNPTANVYKYYPVKNIKLFDAPGSLSGEQKQALLDKWVQTVRFSSK